jgi:predicted metalloprotease with PDZ domain
VLGPFDYTGPCRTGSLWLSEGVTSYYGDLTLARAGVWKRQRWYDHVSREIGSLQSNEARKTMSVEKASWTVWDRDRGPSISYYTKGELLGLLLDLRIREATNNARSLDDVMRHLNWWFAKKGVGFEEGDIERAVSAVAQRSFADFFARYVAGVEELPYRETLALAGLRFEDGEYDAVEARVRLALSRLARGLEDGKIATVAEGTRAAAWGFRPGDRLVSILDGAVADVDDFEKFLSPEKLQDRKTIPVVVERDGQSRTIEIPFQWQKKRRPRIAEDAAATPEAVALRESWLARCGDAVRSRD